MRRELVSLEDTFHRSQAHSRRFSEQSTGPMGFFSRWRSERQGDNPPHRVGRQREARHPPRWAFSKLLYAQSDAGQIAQRHQPA